MKIVFTPLIILLATMSVSCQVNRPDNVPDGATYNSKGGYAWYFCELLNNTLHGFPLYQCTGYNSDGSIYSSGTFAELDRQNISSNHKLNQFPSQLAWWKGKTLYLVYKFSENRSFVRKNGETVVTKLRGYQLWFMSDLCLRTANSKNFQDLNTRKLTDDSLFEAMQRAPSLFRDKMEEQISNIPKHADVNIHERGCWTILNFRV